MECVEMNIRKFKNNDLEPVKSLLLKAFHNHPHGNPETGVVEHFIVEKLVQDNADICSMVACDNDEIIGFITYSQVKINESDLNWVGLGPVAVLPEYQKQGVGKTLIEETLNSVKDKFNGCVVMGDPQYYMNFGFEVIEGLFFDGVPQEYFLSKVFKDNAPLGNVQYNKAFS